MFLLTYVSLNFLTFIILTLKTFWNLITIHKELKTYNINEKLKILLNFIWPNLNDKNITTPIIMRDFVYKSSFNWFRPKLIIRYSRIKKQNSFRNTTCT